MTDEPQQPVDQALEVSVGKPCAERIFNDEEQLAICKEFAQFKPAHQVMRLVRSWGKTCNIQSLQKYTVTKKWIPVIAQMRESFVNGLMEEPIANKRVRLHYLNDMVARLQRQKVTPERDKLILSVLREAREEMEEARASVTNYYLTQLNQYTDEQLVERRKEIVGRIKDLLAGEGKPYELLHEGAQGDSGKPVEQQVNGRVNGKAH